MHPDGPRKVPPSRKPLDKIPKRRQSRQPVLHALARVVHGLGYLGAPGLLLDDEDRIKERRQVLLFRPLDVFPRERTMRTVQFCQGRHLPREVVDVLGHVELQVVEAKALGEEVELDVRVEGGLVFPYVAGEF